MALPIRIRATLQGDIVDVKALMMHPMETGLRKDASGKLIPARYIKTVTVTYDSKTVLTADWGPAISKNPFLEFRFKGGAKGGKIVVTWHDTAGDSSTGEAVVS